MIVIGVDPGLIKTGYGLVRSDGSSLSYLDSGTIFTDAGTSIGNRLKNIFNELNELLILYRPDYFSLEETFVNNNPISSLKLGQARGVALLCAGLNNMEVFEYKPNTIKKSVTGVGKASKAQVGTMIRYLFPTLDPKTEDEADALAIAVCHINNFRGPEFYRGTALS
ncbi:MAG: crossover junction endodeoxyribonuclease RuvC [Rickettsiales bacterium]|jgi:crossover junction endodeoxyribonuclease RuvC|nr:crossover junction endodeoxyribonuclease RuvC [Rickettsiales bacterium]